MIKHTWSEFYGGPINLIMVDNVKQIPDGARYKYTEEDTDISIYVYHEEHEEFFYGVKL
ncbi:hypothetical protein [Phosphitispora fastidiosa]|uniref:hypothetical protein n=1 Tax=Phosphitispora fastidiosa TaxID=2837202 RepID=UPI001E345000|nr:hypothetical protein [Phosphitispora fastidiosa]MBU7006324.1 hypothetical protein [Phosphitispora fastidiosa]